MFTVVAAAPQPHNAAELEAFVEASPFCRTLGIRVERIGVDEVELSLPFSPANVTVGDIVHGGAVTTLADVSAAITAYTGVDLPESPRAGTAGLTVDFLRAARGSELRSHARVLRRTRALCFVEVDVTDGEDLVAKALVTMRVG